MTLIVHPRPLAFVVIDGWEYAVHTDDPRPGCAPSSQPASPATSDAGPETSSGVAGT